MTELVSGIASALWLGILTSISPCPMATNIAALTFISKKVNDKKSVMFSGLFYTLGRAVVYIILGILIINGVLKTPLVARFLQKYMNIILGPILIIIGLVLLKLLPMFSGGYVPSQKLQKKFGAESNLGALMLGILFALSFCPISAALFFGSLLPLSISKNSGFLLPMVYGVGTALPVVLCAILITLGTISIARMFKVFTKIEFWGRWITGIIFVLIGTYFCITYIL